jgi:hypothetical protein
MEAPVIRNLQEILLNVEGEEKNTNKAEVCERSPTHQHDCPKPALDCDQKWIKGVPHQPISFQTINTWSSLSYVYRFMPILLFSTVGWLTRTELSKKSSKFFLSW